MPDLGGYFVGLLWDSAISTGLRLDSTWAGQNLNTRWTQVTRATTTWTARQTTGSHTKGGTLVWKEAKTVMVQEDQAGELWSSHYVLYTIDEGFKAPPES